MQSKSVWVVQITPEHGFSLTCIFSYKYTNEDCVLIWKIRVKRKPVFWYVLRSILEILQHVIKVVNISPIFKNRPKNEKIIIDQ